MGVYTCYAVIKILYSIMFWKILKGHIEMFTMLSVILYKKKDVKKYLAFWNNRECIFIYGLKKDRKEKPSKY